MEQHREGEGDTTHAASRADQSDQSGDTSQDALEAEQESAEAMESDVPQPPDASKTTEGQPS